MAVVARSYWPQSLYCQMDNTDNCGRTLKIRTGGSESPGIIRQADGRFDAYLCPTAAPIVGRLCSTKIPTCSLLEQMMMNKNNLWLSNWNSVSTTGFSISYSRYNSFFRYKLYASIISRIPTFIPSSNALFSQAQHTLPCLTIISSQRGILPPTQSSTSLSAPSSPLSHDSNSLSRALAALPAAVVFAAAVLFSVYVS